MGGREL
jgi:hypothetical protein